MQRATPGSFHTDVQFKNEPDQFPHPPASFFTSSLTAATPAKRITFYKSGDPQFKGFKMAIHKRTFKCFDALLDDLSQKVPLPFGVRTITTPRGIHSIKHLEQLEDGGCYLCSDRQYVKPINMETAGRRPAVWHPHNVRRKPSRPEDAPSGHDHRHPKRIVLIKNNDPAVRRSIILSRRTARSLRVFMDEISELMQCHVKKLYTLEGRKIDSVQSLMQCSGVLVCVGREPFRPLLMENVSRKISDERLPGMTSRSRSSVCSEGHETKKNVNFVLETKKSIIHPRSDSSNRSTRFSLSSEKSYQNGLCITPGQTACVSTCCPYVKEMSVNDDIEKRVLVNKDGSLSVEMKVRFRLFNDETLQWSTEIKKSSAKLTDSGSVKESARGYLQDSISPSETEEAFATKLHEKHLEESLHQNCCNHCQEYDIWKNPMHKGLDACNSPSSSGSSQKIMRKKTSADSTCTISHSSEEYTERVVEKSSCFQQTVEDGDARVEYCERNRCCSRSEVRSKRTCEDGCEENTKGQCCYSNIRDADAEVTVERAISTISNSSKVLQSLKDDQDDDYDDLPPSVSRASNWSQGDAQSKCIHCCGFQTSSRSHLSPRPPSKVSSCTVPSVRSNKYKNTLTTPIKTDGYHTERTTSAVSHVSSRSHACDSEAKTSVVCGSQRRAQTRNTSSRQNRASHKSQADNPESTVMEICPDEKVQENGSLSATSARSDKSSVCSGCGERKGLRKEPQKEEKDVSSTTTNTQENCEAINNCKSDEESKRKRLNCIEKCPEYNEASEERTVKNVISAKSIKSDREPTLVSSLSERAEVEEKRRACFSLDISASSTTSHKSKSAYSEQALTHRSHSSDDLDAGHSQSDKSTMSDHHCKQDLGLAYITCNKANTHASQCCTLLETKATEDFTSADIQCESCDSVFSCSKSNVSSKYSHVQKKKNHSSITCNERVPSATSAQTNTSSASRRSHKSSNNLPETTDTSVLKNPDGCASSRRATSVISRDSTVSEKSHICPETSQETKDGTDVTQNALNVTCLSPNRRKTANSEVNQSNDREPSEISVSSSQTSTQCHCHGSSSSHLEISKSKTQRENVKDESEKVKMKSLCSQLNEPLSPTSTVSIGLPEGQKCDDFPTSDMSIITEDVNDMNVEEKPKTAVSVTFMTSVQSLSPERELKNTRASSALAASSSCTKSNTTTKTHKRVCVDDTSQAEMSEVDNASNKISETSSKYHQSGKTTPASDCFNSSEISKKDQSTKEKSSQSLPPEKPKKTKTSVINPDSSDGVLSRARSAAELLREMVANARPASRESREDVEKMNDNKSSRENRRKVSNTLDHNTEEQYSIMPSCLPNTSPAEVVNDWLMNNPIDGPAYEIDVEFTENNTQGESLKGKSEAPENIIQVEEPPAGLKVNSVSCDDEKTHVESSKLDSSSQILTKKDCLDKQHHSSVQVMKVLLGPKLDRCSSLPEISPVYGRKLSRSAQGLLDCLANLRLIESDSKNEKHPKYNEVMTILQSLWLNEPSEDEANNQSGQSAEDEFNLQSSSGVDVRSDFTASVKGHVSAAMEKSETTQGKISPIPELETSKQDKGLMKDEKTSTAASQCEDTFNVISDPITPDIAEGVQSGPEDKDVVDEAEDEVQSGENKDESHQFQQTSSKKSSESNMMKSAENTSSGTPLFVQRAPLAKRVSQDPDPVWVLSLLKKLEKQFMLHYADAMAEFKVKWDLDDSEMLNAMIGELKEEVHKRIQSSINRELQKIQSRAGQGPRPPDTALSRESTAQTEQRRRRLRVMRNKSITLSRSEENTETSDQRSDEEYCPCDACMKRKMASRGVQRAEALSLAPVMMEFDLRKILEMKKNSVKPAEDKIKDQSAANKTSDKEDNNLKVLHEEEEEVNDNVSGKEDEDQDVEIEDNSEDVCADHKTKDKEDDGEEQEGERAEEEEDDDQVPKEETVVDNGRTDAEEEEDGELVGDEKKCEGDNDEDITEDGDVNAKDEEKETEENMEAEEEKTEDQPITGESKSNLEKSDEKKKEAGSKNNSQTEKDEEDDDDEELLTTSRSELKDSETDKHTPVLTEKDQSADSSAVDSDATRTSVESQPGSVESCTSQTQRFMESAESQGDSVVVITKQPPYKENNELHHHQNHTDNTFTEWQISPKIRNRTCKQKKLNGNIMMNGK